MSCMSHVLFACAPGTKVATSGDARRGNSMTSCGAFHIGEQGPPKLFCEFLPQYPKILLTTWRPSKAAPATESVGYGGKPRAQPMPLGDAGARVPTNCWLCHFVRCAVATAELKSETIAAEMSWSVDTWKNKPGDAQLCRFDPIKR